MPSSAIIDGQYRYSLSRIIGGGLRRIAWIMLNPSTAGATADDPTIRRVLGYSKDWGYDIVEVVNLFAFRAKDPLDLATQLALSGQQGAVGWHNQAYVDLACLRADLIVPAWGAAPMAKEQYQLTGFLTFEQPMCLGTTQNGSPKHPLYIAASTGLRPWEGY